MKIRNILFSLLLFAALSASATIPPGYYSRINGKSGIALKDSVMKCIENHAVLSYGYLWEYYPSIYYAEDKSVVFDMYSDNTYLYNSSVALPQMNKEHTVPKSWWGGSTESGPGCDIINVIPGEAKANNAKKDNPMGIANGTLSFDNGVTKVGTGVVNGYSDKFFEPADIYKGNFARIYLYVATCYPDIAWDIEKSKSMTVSSRATLKEWVQPMLLEWNKTDAVDANEIAMNERIFQIQGNRNPFIDYPELAEYIWGEKKGEPFLLSEHNANEGVPSKLTAVVPTFNPLGGTSNEPKDIETGSLVTVKGSNSINNLYVRINDGDWECFTPTTAYNPSTGATYNVAATTSLTLLADTKIEAYCTQEGRDDSDITSFFYHVVDHSNDYLLYTAFDDITNGSNVTTSNNSSAWKGNDLFPADGLTNAYAAGAAVRLGKSNETGRMISREIEYDGGKVEVEIEVKGWTTVEGRIAAYLTGSTPQDAAYQATMNDDWQTVTMTFEGVSKNPQLTVASTSKRLFVNKVAVKDVTTTDIEVPAFSTSDNTYYSISGQRFCSHPTRPGIYIFNGKKIVVKAGASIHK